MSAAEVLPGGEGASSPVVAARKESLVSGESPAASIGRPSLLLSDPERRPSTRKLSILSDAVHERRPSEVVEARKSSLLPAAEDRLSGRVDLLHGGASSGHLLDASAPSRMSLDGGGSDDPIKPPESLSSFTSQSEYSSSTAAPDADGGARGGAGEMLAIPEDGEMRAIPEDLEVTATITARSSPRAGTPTVLMRASQDELGISTSASRTTMSMANTGNKLREGLLASIRGFRKAVKNAVFASSDDDDKSQRDSVALPSGTSASINFSGVDPIQPPAVSASAASEEEIVGKSELYGAFFRMLRMGVPPGAVKSKMASKGLNGAVLDLGEDGTMAKAHELEVQYENELKRKRQGPAKGEKLHWETLVLQPNKETVFDTPAVALAPEVLQQVEAVFVVGVEKKEAQATINEEDEAHKRAAQVSKKITRATTGASLAQTALDPRRAQGINIMTKKLKLTPGTLCDALVNMDEKVLTAGAVEVLLATVVWPASDEEVKALQVLIDRKVELQGADAVVWLVHQLVPDAESRLKAMGFRYEFDNSIAEVNKAVVSVKQAAKEVVASARLKQIIQVVLQLGNKVNEGSGVQASAFTIASLNKLALTKSVNDKSVTMLDFLAKTLEEKLSDSLKVFDDLPSLAAARKVELSAQLRLLRDSRRAVEALFKVKQLEVFAFHAIQTLDQVESQTGVARDFFDKACLYFAIAPGAMDSHEFFETLWVFLDGLTTIADKLRAINAKKEKAEKEAQRKVVAAAGGKDQLMEMADIDAQLAAVPKKARKSVLQAVAGAFSRSGPPRPPVPTLGQSTLKSTQAGASIRQAAGGADKPSATSASSVVRKKTGAVD